MDQSSFTNLLLGLAFAFGASINLKSVADHLLHTLPESEILNGADRPKDSHEAIA